VLDSLIRGAARFSSRSAVFLHRDGKLEGWGGTGFGDHDPDLAGMNIESTPSSPWERVASGSGGIGLTSSECAVLSEALGCEAAEIGVLVPFILQDQVAAVIYADRTPGGALNITGLQLLSFVAGQTVETLPVRGRAETRSLQLAVQPEAVPTVAAEEPLEPVEPEPKPEPEPELETDSEVVEPQPEAAFEVEPEPLEPPASEDVLPSLTEPSWAAPEPLSIPDEEAPGLAEPESAGPAPAPSVEQIPDTPPPAPAETVAAKIVKPVEPPVDFETGPSLEEPAAEPSVDPTSLGGSTQVRPPSDVEGPGWAFTTTKIPTSAGAEAMHEEARRLARLLVTEIKLYNEELVEEGRSAGDVYSRLREDIERSRQIFDDRIEPDVRSEKDYFHEALVRILAGGDPAVLGA